ncbi:Sorcin like [Actinidia chinensis var. chinensis]|uniref:Sorcin like n=1 Tax=Actinidia chinensis var. chinensis TaxID=1590841 RepID=A0A2R6QHZ0_ACTCC|nr:Sorcin like [Actinidia chinensis var. chinensis]
MENTAILRQWFDRVDSEKTGNITAAQLKSALVVGNLEFPITVVQQMCRIYDFDRNGTMNFEGLTCFLRLGEGSWISCS